MSDANPIVSNHPKQPATNSPPVFPLKEMGKTTGQWSLTIHPAHLALSDAPGAQPYIILREQLMKSVMFMESGRALMVDKPRKISFRLSPEGAKAVADWLGKPFLASFYLKRRFGFLWGFALLWIVVSLASLLPPPPNSTVAPHFDPVSFTLGFSLFIACLFAKWRPSPALFLVDTMWFALAALNMTAHVVAGYSKGWLVLACLLAWMSVMGFKHFLRFRGTKLEPQRK